jgi:hypothetical protein
MKMTCRSGHDLVTAGRVFNMAITAVGGLFLATHSLVVTLSGTTAACLLDAMASLPARSNHHRF